MDVMETLYRIHYKKISKYVLSQVQITHVAQEIAQETFVRALENKSIVLQLDEQEREFWLLKVARNLCIDRWRRIQKQKLNMKFTSDAHITNELMDDSLTSSSIYQYELRKIFHETVPLLKREHQEAINCFDIKQLNYKECADEMGISEVAFSSLLKRARRALIKEILKVYHPQINKVDLSERELKQLLYWFDIVDFPINIDEEISSKTRNFFNGLNQNYESFREYAYPKGLDDYLILTIKLEKWMKVADFGCGSGNLAMKLSSQVADVYAIDHSIEMINTIKKKTELHQLSNIHPIKIDLCSDLSFLHQKIDVAYCCMTLHHVFDPKAVLQEIANTLVQGGHLIIADLIYTNSNWKFKDVHDFWSGFKQSQLKRWIEDVGLKVIRIEENNNLKFSLKDLQNEEKRIEVSLLFAHCVKEE